jgi:hypothetical protein
MLIANERSDTMNSSTSAYQQETTHLMWEHMVTYDCTHRHTSIEHSYPTSHDVLVQDHTESQKPEAYDTDMAY